MSDAAAPQSFFDVVRTQRAHRALRPDPVPEALIERVLDAATFAPSAENTQPWEFVVVRDSAVRRRIGEIAAALWRAAGAAHSRGRISPSLFASVERWATEGLAAAPVIVVVCGDTERTDARSLAASVFPATQNLCLAAHALGLGSLFSTLPTIMTDLQTLLHLPPAVQPMAVVPMGFPSRALRPPTRVSFREKSHRDRFGMRW